MRRVGVESGGILSREAFRPEWKLPRRPLFKQVGEQDPFSFPVLDAGRSSGQAHQIKIVYQLALVKKLSSYLSVSK
jgi:hypothetical protein